MVGELHRVDWIHIKAVKLERKHGAFVSHIAVDDRGLNTKTDGRTVAQVVSS